MPQAPAQASCWAPPCSPVWCLITGPLIPSLAPGPSSGLRRGPAPPRALQCPSQSRAKGTHAQTTASQLTVPDPVTARVQAWPQDRGELVMWLPGAEDPASAFSKQPPSSCRQLSRPCSFCPGSVAPSTAIPGSTHLSCVVSAGDRGSLSTGPPACRPSRGGGSF